MKRSRGAGALEEAVGMIGSEKPRRPLTAYLIYLSEQNLGKKWERLSAKQRAKYVEMHNRDVVRHATALREWEAAGGKTQHIVPKPKGALQAFFFYSKEQNINNKWRQEPESVRQKYYDQAKSLLEEYHVANANYEEKFGKNALSAPDWPRRPLQPYMRFTQSRRESIKAEHPSFTTAQIGSQLGAEWRAMNGDQKQIFVDQYESENENWIRETKDYETRWGSIKFIKKARQKEENRLKNEEIKEKEQEKRELVREKNKLKREKEVVRSQKEKAAAALVRERLRAKKQKEKETEKMLRYGLALYKRENRNRLKRKEENKEATTSQLNSLITTMWSELSKATQKAWARRAILLREQNSAAKIPKKEKKQIELQKTANARKRALEIVAKKKNDEKEAEKEEKEEEEEEEKEKEEEEPASDPKKKRNTQNSKKRSGTARTFPSLPIFHNRKNSTILKSISHRPLRRRSLTKKRRQ